MKKKLLCLFSVGLLLLALLGGCAPALQAVAPEPSAAPEPALEPAAIKVVGPWEDFVALETVADGFVKKYPGCSVEYEYVQDYYAALEKRLSADDPDSRIDLFITTNVQADSPLLPYAQDLYALPTLDLSQTFPGLIRNFELRESPESARELYAVPIGAEIRGMFVNTTLLQTLDIPVPANQAEFLAACKTLSDKGYIPLQGNPGNFAQLFLYPYVCNLIANAADPAATYAQVNSRSAGASELFRAPMELLYTIMANRYYDYKRAETELGLFKDASDESYTRYFLDIVNNDGAYAKQSDVGRVAFLPSALSLVSAMEKTKSDFHSQIQYEFILSPVGPDGGYAYLSPAHGVSINKHTDHMEAAAAFLNYLFEPENSVRFAEAHHVIANTKDAFAIIAKQFDVPESHISHLGEVTFDFSFYGAINESLTEVAKGNNPKYMQDDGKGGLELYDLAHYMELLEQRLTGTAAP